MTPTPIYNAFVERLAAALTAADATFNANDRPTLKKPR